MYFTHNSISQVLRLYKTPTHEKILSFKRHETCPVYTRFVDLANKIESPREYFRVFYF